MPQEKIKNSESSLPVFKNDIKLFCLVKYIWKMHNINMCSAKI